MEALEKELIGVCLNTPDASLDALGVLPEYFSDERYAAIWARMRETAGQFSLATIMSDIPGAADLAYAAFDETYADFTTTRATATALIEDYKRRQAKVFFTWMETELDRGQPLAEVLTEYRARLDDLGRIGEQRSRFKALRMSDIEVPITPWLIKAVMPQDGVGYIAGAPGAGKSFLTIHTALSLATGRGGVFGKRCETVAVAYFAAEDFEGCKTRVKAWELRHPTERSPAFDLYPGPVNLLDMSYVNDIVHAVNETARHYANIGVRLGLVVFDTLAKCTPGADENNSKDMGLAVAALDDIARRTGAFVLAVAHHGKSGTEGGIRGWSGINGASDMTITVEWTNRDEPERTITMSKIKNGQDGTKLTFTLDRVGLGIFDRDNDEIDSCVCIFGGKSDDVPKKKRAIPPHVEIVLRAINWRVDNGETQTPPEGSNARIYSRAVPFADVKDRAIRTGFQGTGENGHKRFSHALEVLIANKEIGMDTTEDLIWLL